MKTHKRMDEEAVSPVIGVILMVAITVILATIVFVLVTEISGGAEEVAPRISFGSNETELTVISAPNGLVWADFTVTGCTTVPTGNVDAGDKVTGCSASITVRHDETNTLVYSR